MTYNYGAIMRWRAKHAEAWRAYSMKWRAEHPDYHPKWRKDHADTERVRSAAWLRAHPEYRRAKEAKRRAIKLAVGGSFTVQEWFALLDAFGGRCAYCGRNDVKLEADHKIPLSRGGDNNITNIAPCCRTCNSRKRAKTDSEFYDQLAQERSAA